MSAYCKNCINAVKSNLPSGELFCKVFPFPCDEILGCSREPKPQTNADRIRAMTDEELAKAIDSDFNNTPWCNNECSDKCIECIIKWLKEKRDC